VIFNTGTDEHGINIYRKAQELGRDPQEYVDEVAQKFQGLKELLNLSFTNFIRTTDAHHVSAAQEFWRRCEVAGDIYKQAYKIKYCTGCELEKTDSELTEDGKCLLHPTKEIEILEEENYFFRWSKYQDALLELYKNQPEFVLPKKRLNEIKSFVERGINDFSISRRKEKLPWGVAVPGDEEHVMYVWFDALVNYISTLGWPNDKKFDEYWPGIQIAGKDNVRQQAAMWQGMLASAGLPFSKQILINGFINVDGQKMSKSLGNVITPEEMVEKFGIDGTRYLLLSLASLGEDSDISWERATEKYNADLANGLGNLVSRVIKLSEKLNREFSSSEQKFSSAYMESLESFEIAETLKGIWEKVDKANEYMSQEEPWKLAKENESRFQEVMNTLLADLEAIAFELAPLLPNTSEKIQKALQAGKTEGIFQRIS
jgi:methionyl-tRNA synthetase